MTAHKNVYAALAAAQSEMSAPVKGSVNPAFRSKYADLADVVNAVAPALSKHGIAFSHFMSRDDYGLWMTTVLNHGDSDTSVACPVPLIVGKNDMHGLKSATTYAKRIGLESVTGVAPEDDDGNAAAKSTPSRAFSRSERPAEPPHDPQTGEVMDRPMNPAQAASQGLRDAWLDGIKDSMSFDASDLTKLHPAQRLQFWSAVSDAMIAGFAMMKSPKGVRGAWDKRADLMDQMMQDAPAAYYKAEDAFKARLSEVDPVILGDIQVA